MIEKATNYSVTALVCPNAGLNYIMDLSLLYVENFDTVVVMAGTNDVNEKGFIDNSFFNGLAKLNHICKSVNNVYVVGVPKRKDKVVPMVRKSNHTINETYKALQSCSFINIDNFHRELFTSHGLHLNMLGKEDLATVIINNINDSLFEFFSFTGRLPKRQRISHNRRR